MSAPVHFVSFSLTSGNAWPTINFQCKADEDAACRTLSCQTCWSEERDRCECSDMGRTPDPKTGQPCFPVSFMHDGEPMESYDGPDENIRGPEPHPVTFTWEGDYYTWEYAR